MLALVVLHGRTKSILQDLDEDVFDMHWNVSSREHQGRGQIFISGDCGRSYSLKLSTRYALELNCRGHSKSRFAKVPNEVTTRIDHVRG